MHNKGFEKVNKQLFQTTEIVSNIISQYQTPIINSSVMNTISKLNTLGTVHMQASKIFSSTIEKIVNDNMITISKSISATIQSISQITIPKINFPVIDNDTYKRCRFLEIASELNFPIYLEVGTELQDKVLEVYDQNTGESIGYIHEQIRQCILDYYSYGMMDMILNSWLNQQWLNPERKAALQEAVELYEEGRYFGTGSTLMCQIGGVITDLYDVTNAGALISEEEKKEVLALYSIGRRDSEKAKLIQMMSTQSKGAYLWYESAEYFMQYTYSSSKERAVFEENPGRNKICHGEQTNYGKKVMALKAILATDIVIQLGIQMLNNAE